MKKEYNILIAGDVHGHYSVLYSFIKNWQEQHKRKIDLILQTGDMGIYPDPSRADKATIKFAKNDPEEFSFINFYYESEESRSIFKDPGFSAPDLYFIKGNHEDFEYLNSQISNFRNAFPIDYYKKMFYIPGGNITEINLDENVPITIAALGGTSYENSSSQSHLKYYSKSEVNKLLGYTTKIDILLTHDVPYEAITERTGSIEIKELLNILKPSCHFCGHYHIPGRQLDINPTKSYILNEINYKNLDKNCIGLLKWPNKQFSFINKKYNKLT